MNVLIFMSFFLDEAQSSSGAYSVFGHEIVHRQHLTEGISDFLKLVRQGDCQSLKDHTSGAAKGSVKKVQDLIQTVGPELSKDNPMILPIIMMASGWITSTSHNMIDSAVENQLCQVLEGVSDGVKTNIITHAEDVVKSLGHKDQCQNLQAAVKNARKTFKEHMNSHLTSFAEEMGTALNFPAASAVGMMAQNWIMTSLDVYTEPLITDLCDYVYNSDQPAEEL